MLAMLRFTALRLLDDYAATPRYTLTLLIRYAAHATHAAIDY